MGRRGKLWLAAGVLTEADMFPARLSSEFDMSAHSAGKFAGVSLQDSRSMVNFSRSKPRLLNLPAVSDDESSQSYGHQ